MPSSPAQPMALIQHSGARYNQCSLRNFKSNHESNWMEEQQHRAAFELLPALDKAR